MPVPTQIAEAALSFRRNSGMLTRSFAGLTPEEWVKSPGERANPLLWIAGHILWARSAMLPLLGAARWSQPWLKDFARGVKRQDVGQYPLPEEILQAFEDVKSLLREGFENASAEAMAAVAPPKSPSADGTVGGAVNFFASHETYHVGQVAYLCCWLGHDGPQG